MSLSSLLSSSVPPHSFLVDDTRLAYGNLNRRRAALARAEVVPLVEAWCRLGPVGLLQVDRQALSGALASMAQRIGKLPPRASLVVPNDWVRTVLVDGGGLPRQRKDAEDVLRWRLKKLLPCRPEEVRLDFTAAGNSGRVLVMLTLDRPLATLEEAFGAAGVSLGRIEPMALALTALLPRVAGQRLLCMLQPRSVGLVLVANGGEPLLVRHKVLLGTPTQAQAFLARELSRTYSHAAEGEGQTRPLEVLLLGAEDELAETVVEWAGKEQGVTVRRLEIGTGPWPQTEGLEGVHLAALLATALVGEG